MTEQTFGDMLAEGRETHETEARERFDNPHARTVYYAVLRLAYSVWSVAMVTTGVIVALGFGVSRLASRVADSYGVTHLDMVEWFGLSLVAVVSVLLAVALYIRKVEEFRDEGETETAEETVEEGSE